ncbi:Butyrophilin subfamily 1 member A1 [Anabarilius grahami]|uniref:Butyrophilin subfamily 1 member A1 n=1 Tax=Anabarilius grahami TaxID=495550 RepID=A0A3N0XSQ2_ANAGA|nr:Butyrophilin subfamily 1 member A1 [Anabarilius grahami]
MKVDTFHFRCLALVMTLVLVTASTDDPPTNITAVLGDTTTFRCHIQKQGIPVARLYIQRVIKDSQEIFINGFDSTRKLVVPPEYQKRTKVNKTDLSMELTNVSVSDEGLYKCVVFFNTMDKEMPMIHLKVIAKYRVPTIEKECSKHGDGTAGKSCQLSCSSVGGYPQSAVKWAGLNLSLINVVHNESSEDLYSKTWTINQTITYNCDQPTNVSCAVEGAISPAVSICEKEPFSIKVITAIVVLVCVLLIILAFVLMKFCCGGSPQGDGTRFSAIVEVVRLPDGPRADCPAERCVFKVALLLNLPAGRDKRPGTFEQAFTQSFIRKRTLFPQHPEAAVGSFYHRDVSARKE